MLYIVFYRKNNVFPKNVPLNITGKTNDIKMHKYDINIKYITLKILCLQTHFVRCSINSCDVHYSNTL